MSRLHVTLAAKVAITVGIAWFLAMRIDLGDTLGHAAGLDAGWATATLAALWGQMAITAVRWRALVVGLGAKLLVLRAVSITFISLFFNLVTPGTMGADGMRIWLAVRDGMPMSKAFNSVLLERMISLLSLVLMITAGLPWLVPLTGSGQAGVLVVFPIILGIGTVVTVVLMMSKQLKPRLAGFNLLIRLLRPLSEVGDDAWRLAQDVMLLLIVSVWAILSHLGVVVAFYCLCRGIGVPVSMADCLILIPAVIFMIALPISFAGWGVREGAMVTALGFVGIKAEAALAVSVLFGLANMLSCSPGGLIWLCKSKGE